MDKCGLCGGDNTSCRLVSGVFKHSLSKIGYHKIVEIPEGATKINVTEMVKSRNYLGGKRARGHIDTQCLSGSFTTEKLIKAAVLRNGLPG